MLNQQKFEHLVPLAVRSVPYIASSHVCKGYIALENLHAQKPHWPQSVWDYCTAIIENDEPKVDGLIIKELLDLESIEDPTSGRDFGPDYILRRGLLPLSYWAMRKKVHEMGFEALWRTYLSRALDHPRFLGHEISVLASYWFFYQNVVSKNASTETLDLFIQRFAEYAVVTFHSGKETVFEHPPIDSTPSEAETLKEALINPGFFGHHILACVWAQRIKPLMTADEYQQALHNLTILNRWHAFGQAPTLLEPHREEWTARELDAHFERFFLDGPTNTHQITLADVLLEVWSRYPEYRSLCAANIACFTRSASPQ